MKRYGWKIFDRCSQKLFSVNPIYLIWTPIISLPMQKRISHREEMINT